MSFFFEEKESNWNVPSGVGLVFLIALSILGGWSIIYTPSFAEAANEDWGRVELSKRRKAIGKS
jgi:hypothetical protein